MERTRRLAGWLVLLVLICTPAQSQGQVCGEGILSIGGCETAPVQVPARKVAATPAWQVGLVDYFKAGTWHTSDATHVDLWTSQLSARTFAQTTGVRQPHIATDGTGIVYDSNYQAMYTSAALTTSTKLSVLFRVRGIQKPAVYALFMYESGDLCEFIRTTDMWLLGGQTFTGSNGDYPSYTDYKVFGVGRDEGGNSRRLWKSTTMYGPFVTAGMTSWSNKVWNVGYFNTTIPLYVNIKDIFIYSRDVNDTATISGIEALP